MTADACCIFRTNPCSGRTSDEDQVVGIRGMVKSTLLRTRRRNHWSISSPDDHEYGADRGVSGQSLPFQTFRTRSLLVSLLTKPRKLDTRGLLRTFGDNRFALASWVETPGTVLQMRYSKFEC